MPRPETLHSETQQQSRAASRPGKDSILCKRDSNVINEQRNTLGALFGFGQKRDSPRVREVRQMKRWRNLGKFSTSYLPTSTLPVQADYLMVVRKEAGKARGSMIPRRITDAFACNQATTCLCHTGVLQSFAHPLFKKVSELCLRKLLEKSPPLGNCWNGPDDCIIPQL